MMTTASEPASEPARGAYPARPAGTRSARKERFGGIKWGSAFFGWLTATGTGLLLTAVVAAVGAATGLTRTPAEIIGEAAEAAQNPATASVDVSSAAVLLAVLFVAYYCGGYVAGRMARFHGVKQGLAVWLWAIAVVAVVVAAIGALDGSRFDVLATVVGLRVPINESVLSAGGIVAAVLALVASLVGAVLGGLAGMRYHRRVDRAATEPGD
jgi:MFS family permease